MKILIAFDTRNGSTTEVARTVEQVLVNQGLETTVLRARDVKSLDGVDGLVVGAPLYSGRWLSGGHRMLKKTAKLPPGKRPALAVFALGPRRNESPENWEMPQKQFDKALAKHPGLEPVATTLFGGADPPKKSPRRDVRDWEVIRTWAETLAGKFKQKK